jgi:hypothetical protein
VSLGLAAFSITAAVGLPPTAIKSQFSDYLSFSLD